MPEAAIRHFSTRQHLQRIHYAHQESITNNGDCMVCWRSVTEMINSSQSYLHLRGQETYSHAPPMLPLQTYLGTTDEKPNQTLLRIK